MYIIMDNYKLEKKYFSLLLSGIKIAQ